MLYPDMNLQKRTQQNTTRYRTALYLRLSREDGDKTESDSIANQRTLLEAYAADHPELCIVDEFVDDGYSGSNFERPAFQRLFRELEQGTINCVLVKDLSRFGRNYIEVGRYLERIFPVMRVRLIAVTDNYDSQSAWKTSDSIMVPMRNLLNDAYCRDISVKIKSQLAVKRKRGDFVGSFATYGYSKRIEEYSHKITELEAERQNLQTAPNAYPFLDVYRKYRKLEEITRPMVVELIEKIEVYEGNRVEITFRFHDEIADLLEELHQKQMEQHEVSA